MVEGFLEPHAPEWTAWKTSNNLKSITVNILCFGACHGYIISLTIEPLKSILLFWHNRHRKWAHMGSLRLSSRFDNFLPCTTYFQIRSNMAEIQIGSLYSFDRYGGSSFRKFLNRRYLYTKCCNNVSHYISKQRLLTPEWDFMASCNICAVW